MIFLLLTGQKLVLSVRSCMCLLLHCSLHHGNKVLLDMKRGVCVCVSVRDTETQSEKDVLFLSLVKKNTCL